MFMNLNLMTCSVFMMRMRYNFRESLELHKKLIREEQEDPLMKEYAMCKIMIDCKCDCEGTPSYRGCTLVYRCRVCGTYFTMGPWVELSAPIEPIAFHNCQPVDQVFQVVPKERFRGLGELMGVIWGEKNVVDGQDANVD